MSQLRTKQRYKYKQQSKAGKSRFDSILFTVTLLLTAFGVLMVYDASVVEAYRDFSDKLHFAKLQLVWAVVGILSMLVVTRIPLGLVKKLALPFFAFTVLLLIAVIIPGVGQQVQGARRWLIFGPITIQPSEIVKLSFAIYLSVWLENKRKFSHFLALSVVILALVMAQPDLGTSLVVIATGITIYFLSGAPLMSLGLMIASGAVAGLGLILSSPYRKARLLTFLNPASDPLGASYHIRQILIALGSGGLLGVGIGRSRQKYEYLPEATTDSIFAVIGEEIGFIGSAIFIILFLMLIFRGFTIARKAKTTFAQLLAGGITAWIGIQALLNLSAMVALVPLTGVPLPLISYGGSSLVTVLTGVGLLLNVSRNKHH